MIRKFKFIISLAIVTLCLLATSQSAFSSDLRHGAEVVVCNGAATELYDVYEARVLRSLPFDLGPANISVPDKLKLAIDRITQHDAARGQLYTNWTTAFFSEADLGDYEVAPTHDGDRIATPKGCVVRQLISQRQPEFDGDKRYFIDKLLWQTLTNDQQAAAILHEVIFKEAIRIGQKDSVATRYFNSLIFSDALSKVTNLEYVKLMVEMKFAGTGIDNFGFVTFNGIPYDSKFDGKLYSHNYDPMLLYSGTPLTELTGVGPLSQTYKTVVDGQPLELSLHDSISFYENKALAMGVPNTAVTKIWHAYGKTFTLAKLAFIEFYHDGTLREVAPDQPMTFRIQGQDISFIGQINHTKYSQDLNRNYHTVSPLVFERGIVIGGRIGPKGIVLKRSNGSLERIKGYSSIVLDTNGYFVRVDTSREYVVSEPK